MVADGKCRTIVLLLNFSNKFKMAEYGVPRSTTTIQPTSISLSFKISYIILLPLTRMHHSPPHSVRFKIIQDYSKWTALSATRSGSYLKSRKDIYQLLELVNFSSILNEENINSQKFDQWHKENSIKLINVKPELTMGWSTKIINVYLKTMVYVGQLGGISLPKLIHPPIDQGLWEGLNDRCIDYPPIFKKIYSKTRIKDIEDYNHYFTIIEGLKEFAKINNCSLIELEQYWLGTKYSRK